MFAKMFTDETRTKLQNFLRGDGPEEPRNHFEKISRYLRASFGASRTSQEDFEGKSIIKKEQAGVLRDYAKANGLWLGKFGDDHDYLARGGESTVYLAKNGQHVIKVNDAVYYATWAEYFNSIALHNLFFPTTAYSLLGFTEGNEVSGSDPTLSIVLQQPFIEGSQVTLEHIQQFLLFNSFEVKKRQDYFNHEFRIALEDMHDENVIAKGEMLLFIDTVFYIMK